MTLFIIFTITAIISGLFAGLCILGLGVLVMGMPGVENQFAKGWRMALNVVLIFPGAWLLNYASYFLLGRNLSEPMRAWWQMGVSAIALVGLLLAWARLVKAFKVM